MKLVRRHCAACGGEVMTPQDPVDSLRVFPAALRRVVGTLRPGQRTISPRRGEWSTKELVSHMADSEIAFGWRLRMMLAQERPVLTPYDQEAWAAALNYRGADLLHALELFAVLRRANCALLAATAPSAWKRTGRHPERGEITLRDLVDHRAHHDLHHLDKLRDKIRRIRSGRRGRS